VKDNIQDLVKYVTGTGFFDKIKVSATDNGVTLEAMEKEKDVILKGKFNKSIPGLSGDFGLSNLSLLGHISSDPLFNNEESTIDFKYDERAGADDEVVKTPIEMMYVNKSKSTLNYRFMSIKLVPAQPTFAEPKWDVIIKPNRAAIQQFAWAANGLGVYEQYFIPRVHKNELKFFIGEETAAAQRGAVTFASGVQGIFDNKNKWRIKHIQPILALSESADCEMAFSIKGVIQITLNTGIGQYKFLFPAKSG